MSTIHSLQYELLRYPPYSPDLGLSNYYVSTFKKKLRGRRYEDRSALDSSIHQCLNGLSQDDFTAAGQQLSEALAKMYFV